MCVADPEATVVALTGDYDFQFMMEELAVGAQFNLPFVHVLVNNGYLGLIRQSQRAFDMDFCVQLSFDNINAPELGGYGVDHLKIAEGLGCKALRVFKPAEILPRWTTRRSSWPSTGCRSWSRSSSNGSPTSPWAPRSTTSWSSRTRRQPEDARPSSPCWTDSSPSRHACSSPPTSSRDP